MINEGIKNKPLDRYPYMENELKKYDTMQDDIKKLQGDVQEIREALSVIGENVINLNESVSNLTEVVQYKDFFTVNPLYINYIEVLGSTAFRVGNCVQVFLQLKITSVPDNWFSDIGYFNYEIIPQPVKLYGMTDPRFIAKISTSSGQVISYPIRDEYITVNQTISLSGVYLIDITGGD